MCILILSQIPVYLSNPYRERIVQCRAPEQTPVVMVGNKADLVAEREVAPEMAIQLAQKWQIPYLETSAKTRFNLEEVS
ncbi:hypothetical protein AHF37_12477 [Paragonimus kellicotti]|nr:hypothetical protein AHF37_12477 [Paragonimus kellicotti]